MHAHRHATQKCYFQILKTPFPKMSLHLVTNMKGTTKYRIRQNTVTLYLLSVLSRVLLYISEY